MDSSPHVVRVAKIHVTILRRVIELPPSFRFARISRADQAQVLPGQQASPWRHVINNSSHRLRSFVAFSRSRTVVTSATTIPSTHGGRDPSKSRGAGSSFTDPQGHRNRINPRELPHLLAMSLPRLGPRLDWAATDSPGGKASPDYAPSPACFCLIVKNKSAKSDLPIQPAHSVYSGCREQLT